MDAIILENLTKRFGKFIAVDKVNFSVRKGEIFGFLGANGAGKSTTIRMLCGLLNPSSGRALVSNFDVSKEADKVKKSIGYMSQRFSLYEDITIKENIRFFGGVYGLRGKRLQKRSQWVLKMSGLENMAYKITGTLAGGYKQRLALGCALIHEPKIIFLDEPTGGIDPISRRRFWEMIQNLANSGITVFVTTHFLDEAEYCNTIALINAGKIVAFGTPETLKNKYIPYQIYSIECAQPLKAFDLIKQVDFIKDISLFGLKLHIGVKNSKEAIPLIEDILRKNEIKIDQCIPIIPSLEDVFIHLIEGKNK